MKPFTNANPRDFKQAVSMLQQARSSGKTAAIGLVPSTGCLPPATAIAAGELPSASPTIAAAGTGAR